MQSVKYEGSVGKTLRAYCDTHAHQIQECCYGGGYGTDSEKAYDVFLRAGWSKSDDCVHTIIEETVAEILRELRALSPCDCESCLESLAKVGT